MENELLTLNPLALSLQNEITEEQIWLANQRTQKTKLSYKNAITSFMDCFGFHSIDELRAVKMPLVILWRDTMKQNGMSNSTICHRLSALKSLFNHLCEKQLVQFNPVQGVTYPKVNKTTVSTPAFSTEQARLMLDVPNTNTKTGLRDSAILHVLFYIGCREGAIAKLKVGDFYERTDRFVLDIDEKGENKNTVAIHPELQACLRVYISQLDHKHKKDAPMFIGVKDKAGLKPIATSSIRELFKAYLKKSIYRTMIVIRCILHGQLLLQPHFKMVVLLNRYKRL